MRNIFILFFLLICTTTLQACAKKIDIFVVKEFDSMEIPTKEEQDNILKQNIQNVYCKSKKKNKFISIEKRSKDEIKLKSSDYNLYINNELHNDLTKPNLK